MGVAAFSATDSRAELVAKTINSLANSETKDIPTFPKGTLKEFNFHCIASA